MYRFFETPQCPHRYWHIYCIFWGENVSEHSTKFAVREPTQQWRHRNGRMWWWPAAYCHPIGCYIETS